MADKKQQSKSWLKYSQMGIQMAATIGLGTWLGYYLDEKYEKSPIFTVIFSLLSIGISLYNVIREVSKE